MSVDVRIIVDIDYAQTMLKKIRKNLPGYTTRHTLDAVSRLLVHNTQQFIQSGIGGYNKPPYDTGAMHDSTRVYGSLRKTATGSMQVIAVGGVKRLGKDVDYAGYVYEGRGPHKGNPRHFTDDAVRYSLPEIRDIATREIIDMIARTRWGGKSIINP